MFARVTTILLAVVLATMSAAQGASAAKSDLLKTEQIFAELMALPAKERMQKLVEGAKKEAALVWYAPDREELTNLRVDFFKELHPGSRSLVSGAPWAIGCFTSCTTPSW